MPPRLTLEQIEARRQKAIRMADIVRDDPDLADELESLTPEEYAERRGFQIVENPRGKEVRTMPRPTREELEEENSELWSMLQSVYGQLGDFLEEEEEEPDEPDNDEEG